VLRKETVSAADFMSSGDEMIWANEMVRICKDVAMAYFTIPSRHSPWEKKKKETQPTKLAKIRTRYADIQGPTTQTYFLPEFRLVYRWQLNHSASYTLKVKLVLNAILN
jgi:hypothetical protein